MVDFVAGTTLTAAALDSAFNAYQINAQSGTTYQFALSDHGGLVTASNAAASTYTVPAFATVAFDVGDRITVLNLGAGVVTISPAAGVTINGFNLNLTQNTAGTLINLAANTWSFVPFSGADWGDFSDAATGTYTDADGNWKYKRYTADGTLTVTREGLFDVLVVGAGGSGSAGYANGIGGRVISGLHRLTAATHTVTIGTPAAFPAAGGTSVLGPLSTGTSGGASGSISSQVTSAITGSSADYAKHAQSSPRSNYGDGGIEAGNTLGANGVVIVRVPA